MGSKTFRLEQSKERNLERRRHSACKQKQRCQGRVKSAVQAPQLTHRDAGLRRKRNVVYPVVVLHLSVFLIRFAFISGSHLFGSNLTICDFW